MTEWKICYAIIGFFVTFLFLVLSCGGDKEKKTPPNIRVEGARGDVEVQLGEEMLMVRGEKNDLEVKRVILTVKPLARTALYQIEAHFDFPGKVTESPLVFIPGVFFKSNLLSHSPYSIHESEKWMIREDRIPVPGVLLWAGGRYFGLIKVSEPSRDEGDCDTDIASLGFSLEDRRILFSYPWKEYPYSYIKKALIFFLRDPRECRTAEEKTFELILFRGSGDIPDALKILWELSFEMRKKMIERRIEDLRKRISMEAIRNALLRYFENYFYESPTTSTSGFFSWVNTYTGKPILHYLEGAFTGMVLMNARNALEISMDLERADIVTKGKKVMDDWLEKRVEGFFPDCLDLSGNICALPTFFYQDSFFTRRQFESLFALFAFAESYKKFSGSDPESSRYFAEFLRMSSLMQSLQKADGSFSKRYSFRKEVLDEGRSGSYFAIPVFLRAYTLSSEGEYLSSAIKTGDFLLKRMENWDIEGSTLDANSTDKEAFLWILYSFYLLWDTTADPRYLEACKKILYPALLWFFLWDVPFSRDSLYGRIGLKTMGLGSVSVENIHTDVYIFFFPYLLRELGNVLGDTKVQAISDLIALSSLNIVPTESEPKGSIVGIVPEAIQQAIWDYGFLGKGAYNLTSATGWTVASILSYIYPLPYH